MNYLDLDIIIKLGITAALGLIIGLEREIKRKPLGLKTCLVISIVSCLLTIISIETAYDATGSDKGVNITMDPLRLTAQIVSGIGFLGAGVILRRGNESISGLTTAAIIWGAAGIGIAVGAGFYFEAILVVIFIMLSVELIPFIMKYIGPRQLREKELSLKLYINENNHIKSIIDVIEEKKITINHMRIKDMKEGNHLIQLKVSVTSKQNPTDVYYLIYSLDGVTQVEIESLD
ncbi:MgtC/SapB family protein [Caldibacillus lycopersici]|uniref:MgtC/SapB family protein n=1 Tax=Perspicuibacillus lycopersici TaxID=1325689 RepID=A0AAE3ITY9_9BACI|nr:MgtC/SapB family protein [Perspicuibacillus lycopersici]MCU9612749.1 MgtC/SapB family protein [Perspicuibacillus lycopersici]